ncbi:hypothetical protein NHX12_025259 [Muraenolepis orangiensis]|uniref:Uncharacterized protein n=1 Tax=Muraenolepis orangiensis TaxID=630683 RepID=A0A9Q0EIX5_9TELE|nr:hypothetical protein NHX12_025259 [Muraenolepis orangiensis]
MKRRVTEALLTGGGEEDIAQVLVVSDVEDLPRDVHQTAHRRRNSPEVQDPEGGGLEHGGSLADELTPENLPLLRDAFDHHMTSSDGTSSDGTSRGKQRTKGTERREREAPKMTLEEFQAVLSSVIGPSVSGGCVERFFHELSGDPAERAGTRAIRFRFWTTDAVYMANVHKIAIATGCRDLRFVNCLNLSTTSTSEEVVLFGMEPP